jgi:hypothetical protein
MLTVHRPLARLLVVFALCSTALAQTTIYGNTVKLQGRTTTINPGSTYTHIYALFPPQINPSGASNRDNFVANVMTQSAIDGVTIFAPWNQVETADPTTTPCSPVGTDLCQQDSAAPTYYHTYTWSAIDGNQTSPCSDTNQYSSAQWFCDFPSGSGTFKKVNFELFGMGGASSLPFTPQYVTTSTWIQATAPSSYQYQDVTNSINAGACSNYSGNTVPLGSNWKGGNEFPNSTITVTLWTNHGFKEGDTIWVSGAASPNTAINVTVQHGSVIHVVTSSEFQYTGSGQTSGQISGATLSAVSGNQSWVVPYELPYASAYEAFLKAAIYHFNNLNNTLTYTCSGNTCNFRQTTGQIAYIRPGVARRGEATADCRSVSWMSNTPYPNFSESQWVTWYKTVNSTVQSAGPQTQIMYSINVNSSPQNSNYATDEAAAAVSYSNAVGMYNGFGSEGLAQADTSFDKTKCDHGTLVPDTGNNWGCMFTKYWSGANGPMGTMTPSPTTVPLELQQIDCSNPTDYTGASSCFSNQMPPGLTLDLRTLYPFATSQHVSILELYSQDALLAYDSNFCKVNGSSCDVDSRYDTFIPSLSVGAQNSFFVNAGVGCSGTNCSYAAAINAAHGYH